MNVNAIIKKLMVGSVLRVFGLMSAAIVAFFLMPYLIHNLGDRNYGLWVLIGTFMGYYSNLDFGLANAVGRFVSRAYGRQDFKELNTIASSAFFLYILIGSAAFFTIVALSFFSYHYLTNPEEAWLFQLMMVILGLQLSAQFPLRAFAGVLTSLVRYDILVGVDLFKLVLRTSMVVYFINAGYGLLALAVITFLSELFANLLQVALTLYVAPFLRLKYDYVDKSRFKELYIYGKVAFVTNITEMLKLTSIPILVGALISVQYVVIYAIAQRLISYLDLLVKNAVQMTMPILSQGEGQGKTQFVKKGFEYTQIVTTMLVTFIGANIMLYGDIFITLWMNDTKFSDSYTVLLILTIPIALSLINVPLRDLLFGVSKHKYCAWTNFIGSVLSISLAIIFTQYSEQFGIAWGVLVGIVVTELSLPVFVKKISPEFSARKTYKNIFMTVLKTIIPVLVTYQLLRFIEIDSFWVFFGVVGISGIIFTPMVYFILPVDIRDRILYSARSFITRKGENHV